MVIGFVAPSSAVDLGSFEKALKWFKKEGFETRVHPQVRRKYRLHAGTDRQRVSAFLDFARDPRINVVWCARGGYGANRLLPLLDAHRGKIPRGKLLVGFSDATALHAYVSRKWGWHTLHAAMPGHDSFHDMGPGEKKDLASLLRGEIRRSSYGRLRFLNGKKSVRGRLFGGNLTLWNALNGTPYEWRKGPEFLFLEEVYESFGRMDRTVAHLKQADAFRSVRGVILGQMENCRDVVTKINGKPIRRAISTKQAFEEMFGDLKIPVAYGLSVGHGKKNRPFPLNGRYRLSRSGLLQLESWGWKGPR